jgi:hypothetical protein
MLRRSIFGQRVDSVLIPYDGVNLRLEGVSSNIYTKSGLAIRLGITENDISIFNIVGEHIEAKIDVDYNLPANAFKNYNYLTAFIEIGIGRCLSLADSSFRSAIQLKKVVLLKASTISSAAFANSSISYVRLEAATTINGWETFTSISGSELFLPELTATTGGNMKMFQGVWRLYAPKAPTIGTANTDNGVFSGAARGGILILNQVIQTNFNGNEDGDITWARTNLVSTVRYIQNNAKPNPITDLSADIITSKTIRLIFTPPNSTNAIEYYDVYVNGYHNGRIHESGEYARNLMPSTINTIYIKAIDIYGNESVSNTVNATTVSAISYQDKIISYYKFQNDVLDNWGHHNFFPYFVAYRDGTNGREADFTGTTTYADMPQTDVFKFSTGSADKPFTIKMSVIFNNSSADQFLLNKRSGSVGNDEWQIIKYQGNLSVYIFNHNTSGFIGKTFPFVPIVGEKYHIGFAYNANGNSSGISLYLNGASVGSDIFSGTYERKSNSSTAKITIGRHLNNGSFFFNGYLDNLIFFNAALTESEDANINNLLSTGQFLK